MNKTFNKIAFLVIATSAMYLAGCGSDSVSTEEIQELSSSSQQESSSSVETSSAESSAEAASSSSVEEPASSEAASSASVEEPASSDATSSSSTEEPTSSETVSSSSVAKVFGVEDCGDLWCGPAKDAKLKNVADGSWHWIDMTSEDKFRWDAEVTSTPTCENCIDYLLDFSSELNQLGAIQGSAILDNTLNAGSISMLTNLNIDGMDISAWDGLCIAYESSEYFRIGLGTKNDENNGFYSILKKTNNTTSVLDLPWSTFKKMSTTNNTIAAATKEVTFIDFLFEAVTPENYGYNPYVTVDEIQFKILSLGKMGTCKGAVTAADPDMCGIRPYNTEKFTCNNNFLEPKN